MKILIIIPYISLVYGGTSRVVREVAQSLGQAGAQVDVVTTDANGSKKLNVPLQTWVQEENYRIQYFPCWHRYSWTLSWSLSHWLLRHVKEYDIVHTHTLFSPVLNLAHQLCRWRQIPYVMTPHGMLEPWALAHKAWKKQIYYTLLDQRCLQGASAIQVLAPIEADQIVGLSIQTPALIVPNGIHRHDFDPLHGSELFYEQFPTLRDKTLIIFLARIDPKKGLDLLAKAFGIVHRQYPNTHLVVAGPDSIGFLPTVKTYFDQAECLGAVTFTGMLSGGLKYAALAAAYLYVAPSYSEGFSISVLEGMATGLPCVITTGCNFSEAAIAQAADVVEIDADAITGAILKRLADPAAAKAMGDRARAWIFSHYTWNKIAGILMQSYQSIQS
jgi:glycosyltransferase involved in cell wall biosynthesis